jgi:negative regulator of sigma E activity
VDERQGSTEAQDVYGTPIRLTPDGLAYGEVFVPLAEPGGGRVESHVFWNPGTRLFEVAVSRRSGTDLIVGNLPLHTADRLSAAIIGALRERST